MAAVPRDSTVWRRDARVLARRTPRSVVVCLPEGRDPLVLEGAAAYVWDALREPCSDAALVASVAASVHDSGATADEVARHVMAARVALTDLGAIVGARG